MINGEKTPKNLDSSAEAANDPFDDYSPWVDRKSDGDSPAPSNYSSCEESEFERYCSANSVIGTASVCSSVGNYRDLLVSDFGSFRNLGFGVEDCISESFGRGQSGKSNGNRSRIAVSGAFDCVSESKVGFHREDDDLGNGLLKQVSNDEMEFLSDSGGMSSSIALFAGEHSGGSTTLISIGHGSKLFYGSDEETDPYGYDNGISTNSTLSREAKLPSEMRNGPEMLPCSDENHRLLVHCSENHQPDGAVSMESQDALPSVNGKWQSSDDVCGDKSIKMFTGKVSGNMECHSNALTSMCNVEGDVKENEQVPELDEVPELAEENSSRHENSDGDDSMFDYGTDGEDRTHLFERRNLQYLKGMTSNNENPLLINSSVAFGVDDWNEFLQQSEENDLTHEFLDKSFEQQQVHLESEHTCARTPDLAPLVHSKPTILKGTEQEDDVRDIPIASCQVQDESYEDLEGCSATKSLADGNNSHSKKPQLELYPMETHNIVKFHSNLEDESAEKELQCVCSEEVAHSTKEKDLKGQIFSRSVLSLLDSPCDIIGNVLHPNFSKMFEGTENMKFNEKHTVENVEFIEERKVNTFPFLTEESAATADLSKACLALDKLVDDFLSSLVKQGGRESKVVKIDTNECYDDMVHEMEEILLDNEASHVVRLPHSNQGSLSQQSPSFRDGTSTASTSGTDDERFPLPYSQKIDWVEVIGAKQKRGDVSLGERLVGVKEYTVYVIRVWSGENQWEVERRYRDFFTLYRQLKSLFADHGWSLPSPWSSVDRESLKIFGNVSPNVISERSALIQECIQSVLHFESPLGPPGCLVWFLSPRKDPFSSSIIKPRQRESTHILTDDGKPVYFQGDASVESSSFTLGKTISLLVDIPPRKSIKQLLEVQYYTCAGCHKHLDIGRTLMRELVQTFGWGKPRLCEYTGQLFCTSCHVNDTAVLPARVLHHWNFSQYPVSQLAKAYLESIFDQKLFAKLPTLLHMMGIRKKIGSMLPYLHCPFRRSIQRALGTRRYLLESNEFFALRDLVDLSKGAFAGENFSDSQAPNALYVVMLASLVELVKPVKTHLPLFFLFRNQRSQDALHVIQSSINLALASLEAAHVAILLRWVIIKVSKNERRVQKALSFMGFQKHQDY
ncbi:hypothetical protein ACLOJK_001935 [Asimina triloba]